MDYASAFGVTSVRDPDATARPRMQLDTVMRLASATKLITTVAALQCVEQGLLGLDDNVVDKVEELRGLTLLTGYNGDKPILEDPKESITIR